MENILIDPSLRRARRVRLSAGFLVAAAAFVLVIFGRGLHVERRSPPVLPSPRRAVARAARRPVAGQRPIFGRASLHRAVATNDPIDSNEAAPPPHVIAFVEPTVRGALVSIDRHAEAISEVATTGLLLGDGGVLVDRINPELLDVARSHHLPVTALVQDLDEHDGRWRGDRVAALARDPKARKRFADALEATCAAHELAGLHLDFEDLSDASWNALPSLVGAVATRMRSHRLTTTVDVPAEIDDEVLDRLGVVADRVVVMAYDQSDDQGDPGAIAGGPFVDDALGRLERIPPEQRVAGLGIYGYDWVGREVADPLSFVDALAAAKEAGTRPTWSGSSDNPHFRFSDEQGTHEVWLLDGATLWNQLGAARRHRIPTIALWRLGGEDPGVWRTIAAWGKGASEAAKRIAEVPGDDRVDNLGDGPFLALALSPEPGRRALSVDERSDRITGERWEQLPSPWLVRRAGIVPDKVALTFDDGPDPRFTPAILDALAAAHAPATFFVIGTNAEREPDLVRRAFAEGHVIGNHSFTHPDIDAVDDQRLRLELELTSRLVETLIGRRPILYRPPSLADIEPRSAVGARAFARAGSLGYLVVDADVDPRDWESPTAEELRTSVLRDAENGGVVLLHDGGGDRSTTAAALPGIIAGLRARGLAIVPLGELVGKTRDEVMPPAVERGPVEAAADHAVFRGASFGIVAGGACLTAALVLVGARSLLVMALALVSIRRRRRDLAAPAPKETISVVVPAFNERAVIVRTVESVLASDVPVEVIVVDDGSTDGTAQQLAARFGDDPRVRVLRRPNGGKAAALNTGFRVARSEAVIALDGDTLFYPDTVRQLVAPLSDRRVGAVAGTADVGNANRWLTRMQALEYLVQQEIERRAWDALGALPVVPGAVGAWRKRAVLEAGGFSTATLAEDADLAMALGRLGWKVVHAPLARARTEAPETVRCLVKQRVRWSFGVLQAMWRHRRALVERRAGALGRIVLPSMILFQVLLPLLTPAATIGAIASALAGRLGPALVATLVLFAVEVAQALLACGLDRRGWRLLGGLPMTRLAYRPLLFAVLLRSLARTLDGVPLGWNKLVRRGTVT